MSGDRLVDLVVVGAGPAGLMTAIFAADRGLSVCLVEASDAVGGALRINRGQLSGAGTRLQAERGIEDGPERHYADAMRISRGTSDPEFLAMAVKLQGPLIDWLMDHGFEMEDDMPRIIHGHEAYDVARTYWGKQDGLSILQVLEPMLQAHIDAGRIDLRLDTRVERLLVEQNEIAGVIAGGESIRARATVLTTGGYTADPALFSRFHDNATLWSGSWPHALGDGHRMAEAAGGTIGLEDTFLPNFGGILDHTLDPPRFRAPGGLVPQDRPPWEIIVNRAGERFVREDDRHVDDRARLLARQPDSRAWVIYDERIRREAPSLFLYFDAAKAARFYDPDGPIVGADTLDALAAACGIDAAGLTRTVAAYNAPGPDPLGREHRPAPIAAPPFYALPIFAYCVRSYAGLKVDKDFKVLDAAGAPIPRLYAVGEILGSLLSGKGAVGGMALSPALAFGRRLGELISLD